MIYALVAVFQLQLVICSVSLSRIPLYMQYLYLTVTVYFHRLPGACSTSKTGILAKTPNIKNTDEYTHPCPCPFHVGRAGGGVFRSSAVWRVGPWPWRVRVPLKIER